MKNFDLFNNVKIEFSKKTYNPILTAVENQKGVLDVDTVKGCSIGMQASPNGGCYNECYANKIASRYGIDFTRLAHAKKTLHTRKFPKREQKIIVAYKGDISKIKDHFAPIGRL